MQRMPAVSRPAWALALTGAGGRAGAPRRSPIEIVATMGSYVTRTQAAEFSGLRAGPFGRWADGVNAMREDCVAFARHWESHNDQVLGLDGPLWVVLGDSTAQGLGATTPDGGYVGQVLAELREQTGQPWRVLNLSVSGSLTRDVTSVQLPRIPAGADLVTCGIGVNDILYTSPGKLFADLRALIAALPASTVLLDLPLPAGCWGFLGRASMPYVNRINRTIRQAAAARGLPVAAVSAHFTPPWAGKFASDYFHPSQDGYRDWTRALLATVTHSVPRLHRPVRHNSRPAYLSQPSRPSLNSVGHPRHRGYPGRMFATAGLLLAGPR
jgi:lysophospholipase L1-like esterase